MLANVGLAQAGSPTATKSGEELVSYVTKGKLDVAKRISYNVFCAADCKLTLSTELELKGPDPAPVKEAGQFPAGLVVEPFLLLEQAGSVPDQGEARRSQAAHESHCHQQRDR